MCDGNFWTLLDFAKSSHRTFQKESDACRFFLKSVLDDAIFWTAVPIVGDNPYWAHVTRHIELLAKYGFERGKGDTKFWYMLIFAILFMGISMAPLYVSVHCSFCGLVASLAYILGWVFYVFSNVFRRYDRFISYRFGWGTLGLADQVYCIGGGVVALFYVVGIVAALLPG